MSQRDKYLEHDLAKLWDAIEAYPFAVVVGLSGPEPVVAHLPFTLQRSKGKFGTLNSHAAAANPIVHHLEGRLLVIFSGPHAYVSAAWYSNPNRVPTWNYVAVHAHGRANLVEDPELADSMMDNLVDRLEGSRPDPWSRQRLTEDQYRNRLKAIRPFEVEIDKLDGVFKLSQDKAPEDRSQVISGLEREAGDRALITLMKAQSK